MKKIMVGIWIVLLFSQSLAVAEMRIWTSVKGDTVEAEFVKIMAGKVILKKPDGKPLKVPIAGLCVADREYLANSIPPKIKIAVDVKKDRDTVSSYSSDYGSYNYERKAETTKCIAAIEKTNKEECSRDFVARLYVIGEEVTRGTRKVLSFAEHEFSFKKQKMTEFRSTPVTTEYTKSDYASNQGYKFEGYLVVVYDQDDNLIAAESNQSTYEKNIHKFKGAETNTQFDDDFDMLNPPKKNRKRRN